MRYLRQNDSSGFNIIVGPFLSASDGITPITNLSTLIGFDNAYLFKFNQTTGTNLSGRSISHIIAGYYNFNFLTGDLDTCGGLRLLFAKLATFLPVWEDFTVLPQNIFDNWIYGNGMMQVDVREWLGTTVPTPDTAGYPKVTVKNGTGPGEIITSSGGVQLDTVEDAYYADIKVYRNNVTVKDEWVVQWFKNAAPVTTTIASPTIEVVKESDGSDLIASSSLSQIGTTNCFKYSEPSNRIQDGSVYISIVQATIDGATRIWRKVHGRDTK